MFAPRDGTYLYSSTRSAVIRSTVAQAGSGARLTAALYHHFNRYHTSRGIGGSAPSSCSTSAPAVSNLCLLSIFMLALISQLSLQIRVWSFSGLCCAGILSLTSLHVSSDLHQLFLLSLAYDFGTALRRAAKILSSRVGADGGRRGSHLRPVSYFLCSLSGVLRRHPSTI